MEKQDTSRKSKKPQAEWQGFYSLAQVSRLTRIPLRTLYNWRMRDIIRPSIHIIREGGIAEEGYSYADLTIIRIMRALRKDQLDLASVGIALRHLYERLGPPNRGWADAQVYIEGNQIFAEKPDEWKVTDATRFGQKVETRLFGDLFEELKDQEEGGSILVPKDYSAFVAIDLNVMGGQPVVRGTRVPTSILAILRDKGKSVSELTSLYRPISAKAIEKAIEYEHFLDSKVA